MDRIQISDAFREGLNSLREVRHALPEVCESNPDLPQRNSELFRIKDDSFMAVRTGDLVITLEPTERLMELVAAARARKGELAIDQEIGEVRSAR